MTKRDIVEAAIDIGVGVIGVAAAAGVLFVLCSCAPLPPPQTALQPQAALAPQTALERAAASTTLAEWSAAKLRAPRRDCRLAELRIEEPKTHADYLARCPWNDGRTWECLAWSSMAPVAVMHPLLARDRVGAHAQHALIHALMHCSGESRSSDSYDGEHRHPKAWEQGGPDSVETRAERALERVLKPPIAAAR